MDSPTRQGGDDDARESAEVLDAEAQLDAPEQHTHLPDVPAPEPAEPEPEPEAATPAERREAQLAARARPAQDATEPNYAQPRDEKGRFASAEDDEDDDVEEEPEAAQADTAPEEEPVPAPSLPPGTRQGEDGQWYVDFTVDGQTKSLPYAQYHANAQKYLTGDQRLQQAALERKRLEALHAQPQGYQPPSQEGAGVTAPPQGGSQGITREQLEKAFLEGDEQAQTALLERLNREQPAFDPNVVPQMAIEAVRAERANEMAEQAAQALSTDEQHGAVNRWIVSDPDMQQKANRKIAELQSLGYTDAAENVRMAVEHVRNEVYTTLPHLAPAPAPPPQPVPDASLTTRTAAKQAHARVNSPTGGQARQPLAPPEPVAPQTRDILAEMRIARGQR